MPLLHWNKRFADSTRGQIIALLRRASRTVEELAQTLNLTDNAVRAHLATLERDGVVQQHGVRRGSGKPSYVYDLTAEAEQLFPKSYGTLLHELLDVLSEQMPAEQIDTLLRAVGRRISTKWSVPPGNLQTRLELAVDVLNELGGLAELEEHDGTYVITGYSCPLAAAVPGHPQVCSLAESLLTEMVGVPVHEHCSRGQPLQCHFVVPMHQTNS